MWFRTRSLCLVKSSSYTGAILHSLHLCSTGFSSRKFSDQVRISHLFGWKNKDRGDRSLCRCSVTLHWSSTRSVFVLSCEQSLLEKRSDSIDPLRLPLFIVLFRWTTAIHYSLVVSIMVLLMIYFECGSSVKWVLLFSRLFLSLDLHHLLPLNAFSLLCSWINKDSKNHALLVIWCQGLLVSFFRLRLLNSPGSKDSSSMGDDTYAVCVFDGISDHWPNCSWISVVDVELFSLLSTEQDYSSSSRSFLLITTDCFILDAVELRLERVLSREKKSMGLEGRDQLCLRYSSNGE